MKQSPVIEPWASAMEKAGHVSINALARASDLSVETVRRVVNGTRAKPSEDTIRKIADALRVSASEAGEWVGLSLTNKEAPYIPPREASLMNQRQRDAVDEVIRLLAATNSAQGNEEETESASAVPSSDPVEYAREAEEKLARALQAGYAPAASPKDPDPYNGVGEESQEVPEQ